MDGDAGANPFWHACLVLSVQDSENAAIRVIDSIGFYSQKSTTTNPLLKGLKHILGFKIDLQDGHGILNKEKMRVLDGNGLHGVIFETTQEQFERLKELYKNKMKLEQEAIAELDPYLKDEQHLAANGYTRYEEEKARAELEKRDSRLSPFHVTLSLTRHGFDSSGSHACKNYALKLLLDTNIIDTSMRDKIVGGAAQHAFPRYGSAPLMPMRLVSTGEPTKEKIYYNRIWGENNDTNKLYWATPIHTHDETLSKEQLKNIKNQHKVIKDILTRARAVEIMLRRKIAELAKPADQEQQLQLKLLNDQVVTVQDLYEKFSISYRNQLKHYLKNSVNQATTKLNIATMSLTPDKMNYSFMLRAYESASIRNAMLGLLGLVIAAVFLNGVVGAVLVTTAALFTAHQLYGFFKEENKFSDVHAQYSAFLQTKKEPEAEKFPLGLQVPV